MWKCLLSCSRTDLGMPPGWLGLAGLLQTNASSSASRTLLGVVCFESGSVLESLASCCVPVATCLPGRARPFPGPGGTLNHTQLLFSGHLYPSPNVGKCENRSKSSNPGNCSTAPSSHIPAMRLMRDTAPSLQPFLLPEYFSCAGVSPSLVGFEGSLSLSQHRASCPSALGMTDMVVLI